MARESRQSERARQDIRPSLGPMHRPEILFVDTEMVAVNKPAGLLVHRTRVDARAQSFALQQVRDAIGRRVWPVHRLDKGTSGVLVFALDAARAASLGQAFAEGRVEKRYLALVRGWTAPSGSVDHPLPPLDDDADGMDAPARAAAAQPAVTEYVRLATIALPVRVDRYPTSRYSLLDVRPRTGRRHQIRRHLKHLAHPVIGDATFGKGVHNRFFAARTGCTRLWLHAHSLALPDPRTGARLQLTAPPAIEWTSVMAWPEWRFDPAADDGARSALLAFTSLGESDPRVCGTSIPGPDLSR